MAKYLVVAHQTAASPELVGKLQEIDAADPEAEFALLVPATHSSHLLTWVEGESEQIAQRQAAAATSALRRAGLMVTNTIIGEADPLKAIEKELRSGAQYAMTIISMLPPGLSRWFRRDLQHQVRSRLGANVAVIIAGQMTHEPSATGMGSKHGELSEAEPLSLRQLARRQGQTVHCLDGPVGQMREVLYDYLTGAPLWLGIFSHPLSVRTLLIPARAVRPVGDHIETPLTRQQVLGQPHVSVGEGFSSLSEEENICRYFGLPFDDVRDTRVLRSGQEFPGLERNEQHILASQ